ncbi:MAG: SDR family oxidoreductase [Myxococcales bacterium]|nr:SDR family oxidoreductase [Myxococcales bacterium]
MLLEDKVAIVTGIGPAMGRSIALAFAREGAKLALCARRKDRLQAVVDEVEAAGGEVLAVPTDITDRAACQRLVDATLERFGRIDVLVQNGHYDGDYKVVTDSDPDDWRAIMEVNLFGALHLVQLVAPSMRSRRDGRIVLINTGASTDPPPTLGAYAASKAALASLARTIAVELGPDGIRANGVQLGPVKGENWDGWIAAGAKEAGMSEPDFEALQCRDVPLRSVPTADECAGAVLFLASDLARPITGQSLAVNGGRWFAA